MGSRRSVEEIFKDYRGRRNGIIKALTIDVDNFFGLCDPEKENLCLYGHPDDSWEVTLPAEEVPPELPEPALGINFARDGMARSDWLSLVAVHSDSWLMSVAFYLGAYFSVSERKRLFTLINDLPTIFEVVSGKVRKERLGGDSGSKSRLSTNVEVVSGKVPKDRLDGDSGSKSKNSIKRTSDGQVKNNSKLADETCGEGEEEEDEEDHNETYCGSCAGIYNSDEFWIMCDMCERWYHGKCVRITPAKAENIKHYKCPYCRARP